MKCPNCGDRDGIEVNTHAEGFSGTGKSPKECGSCGHIWRVIPAGKGKTRIDVIHQGKDSIQLSAKKLQHDCCSRYR